MTRSCLGASVLVLLLGADVARADTSSDSLMREGAEAYQHGEYAHAAELFERAYAEAPSAELLFNLAQAHRRAGACVAAHQRFREYVGLAPGSPAARVAAEHLAEPCAPSSAAPPIEPSAPVGSHAGASGPDTPSPRALPPSTPALTGHPHGRLKIAGVVVGAIGLGSVVAGGIVLLASSSERVCVDKCDRTVNDQEFDTVRAHSTASTTLLVAGGGLVVAGIGLYVAAYLTRATSSAAQDPAPPAIVVTPIAGGAVMGTSWTF